MISAVPHLASISFYNIYRTHALHTYLILISPSLLPGNLSAASVRVFGQPEHLEHNGQRHRLELDEPGNVIAQRHLLARDY